jgi:DNA (cytosine-5)-methyltransferase 1
MPRHSSYISMSDYFCGAGGSSTGAAAVPGVEVTFAANHWKLAIETHATNHPNTQHDTSDLQEVHPSMFPGSTIAWFSPECQSHSNAKGRKRVGINQKDLWGKTGVDPLEERSRSTMREVVEFTEYHRYEAVIVENVSEIRNWAPYQDWLKAMMNLGYLYKEVLFNSMFAHPTPQSRDRIYVVFWKKGNKAPNLDFCPTAFCAYCGRDIESRFSPNPKGLPGRVLYGKSYVYSCPHCGHRVQPYYYAAFNAIDWSLPLERIGNRKKPLAPNTMKRIQRGLDKYKGKWMFLDMSRPALPGRIWSADHPLNAITTKQNTGVVMPFVASYHSGDDNSRVNSVDGPMRTSDTGNRHALIMPSAFISSFRANTLSKGIDESIPAITAGGLHESIIVPGGFMYAAREFDSGRGLDEPMKTVIATANQHGLVIPQPMLSTLRGPHTGESLDKPTTSIVGTVQQALVAPEAFLTAYYGTGGNSGIDEAAPTMTSKHRHALIQSEPSWAIEDAGFRMLEPHEIKVAMGFPQSYIILGNKAEQVKQAGNAVTAPFATLIVGRVVEALI